MLYTTTRINHDSSSSSCPEFGICPLTLNKDVNGDRNRLFTTASTGINEPFPAPWKPFQQTRNTQNPISTLGASQKIISAYPGVSTQPINPPLKNVRLCLPQTRMLRPAFALLSRTHRHNGERAHRYTRLLSNLTPLT